MALTEDHITEAALKLSAEERERLAETLLASVLDDPEIEAAWAPVIARRVEELRAGTAKTFPIEEVLREAENRLR